MGLVYLLLIPVVLAPLASVYVTLRYLKWKSRSNLGVDVGLIWVAWWIGTVLSLLINGAAIKLFAFDDLFGGIGNFLYIFSIEFIAIGLLIFLLRSQRNATGQVDITDPATARKEDNHPNAFFTAGAVSFISLLTLMLSILLIFLGSGIYFHFFPKS